MNTQIAAILPLADILPALESMAQARLDRDKFRIVLMQSATNVLTNASHRYTVFVHDMAVAANDGTLGACVTQLGVSPTYIGGEFGTDLGQQADLIAGAVTDWSNENHIEQGTPAVVEATDADRISARLAKSFERYAMSYPASTGDVVTQGHTNYCAAYGHATTWLIDGVQQGACPRCGEKLPVLPSIVDDIAAAGFTIVETSHDGCDECLDAANSAMVHARVTGSRGASFTNDNSAMTPPSIHSATVARVTNCNCEHVDHFDDEGAPATKHEYGTVPSDPRYVANFVGEVCEDCATTCMVGWLNLNPTDADR